MIVLTTVEIQTRLQLRFSKAVSDITGIPQKYLEDIRDGVATVIPYHLRVDLSRYLENDLRDYMKDPRRKTDYEWALRKGIPRQPKRVRLWQD
jgi:hypothetical protein